MVRLLKRVFEFFASFGLSVVLFLVLLLLTYLGTLHQVEHGLYEAQGKYFQSFFLIHEAFGVVPVPLPGGYLAMGLLFVNLFCGGLIRARKGWSKLGILVAHAGILLLLVGSFITYEFSSSGHMTLYEGESSDEFVSYHEWETAIVPASAETVGEMYSIHESDFVHLTGDKSRRFLFAGLPFDLEVEGYAPNSRPEPVAHGAADDPSAVDGFYLRRLPLDRESERNVAGALVTIHEKETGKTQRGIMWGLAKHPLTFTVGSEKWAVDLRRRRWQVPFTIALNKFTRELYPNTNMPKVFMSDVTKTEEGIEQRIRISMNEPLRHHGYTFFQSSWGPSNAGPNDPLYSTFAVVRNPADQFPLYACVITTLGLIVHFLIKLLRHFKRERMRAT